MTEWEFPVIGSPAHLAEILELDAGQLRWLADLRGDERRASSEQVRNYRYRLIPRRQGGLPRLLEIPKGRTKEIQRWILREILNRAPPHAAATGFSVGGSVVEHARRHCGRELVLRLDLADFFPSVGRGRIQRIFTGLGYRREVAQMLAGLCTNVVPLEVWAEVERGAIEPERADGRRFRLERLLASPHLPQGAPSSPALANLAALALDRRLSGLAAASGLTYSRYVDDLTFSGDRLSRVRRRRVVAMVGEIAVAEGFAVNPAKTAVHLSGGRQPVCGVIANVHPNLPRAEVDRLSATLHNRVVHGPAGQNRIGAADFRAHLRGRIAWVSAVNPARGARLLARFEQIDWPADGVDGPAPG